MMKQCRKCISYDEEWDDIMGSLYGDADTRIWRDEKSEEEDVHFCIFFDTEPIDTKVVNDEVGCWMFIPKDEFSDSEGNGKIK